MTRRRDKRIDILGEPWRIELAEDVGRRMRELGSRRHDRWRGEFDAGVDQGLRVIVLRSGMPPEEAACVLLHELIHIGHHRLPEGTVKAMERRIGPAAYALGLRAPGNRRKPA